MPSLRTPESESDQYVLYTHSILDNISDHASIPFKSADSHFVNKTTATMENHELDMQEPESAYFSDNPELLLSEKSTNERDLEIEVLDIDDLGILSDTEEVNNDKSYSNSLDEHLNKFEIASSSPSKSDSSITSTGKRHKNFGRSQIRNYKCKRCGFSTQISKEYLYHLKDVHEEDFIVHECKNCDYATKIIRNLQRHCRTVHRDKTEKNDSESGSQLTKKFLSKKKSSTKFQCSLCSFNTTSERILSAHVTSHNQVIEEENKEITSLIKYSEYNGINEEHELTSNNEKIALADHLSPRKEKNVKCPLCKMNLRYISWMIRHLRINHRGNIQAETLATAYEMKKRKKRPNHSDWQIFENNASGKRANRRVSTSSKYRQMNSENLNFLSDIPMQSLSSDFNNISYEKPHIDSNNALRCNICYDKFKGMSELQEHMQVHRTSSLDMQPIFGEGSVENEKCDNFENIEVHHDTPKVKVKKQSSILKYVRNGLGSKHSNRKYKCPYCTFSIRSVSRFHLHFIKHIKNLEFICSDCDYRSSWKWTIVKHIWSKVCNERNHLNATVFTNSDLVDLNSFKLYKKYLVNLNQYNSIDQSNVFQLNAVQGSQSSLPAISNICSVNNLLNSSNETSTISNRRSLNVANASRETNYYYCKECSFKNVNKQIVSSHLASHAGINPFECSICNFKSNWKHVTIRHIRNAHSGNYDDLIQHTVNFTEEGFVLCRDSAFTNNDQSYEHREVDSHKVFNCHICPYKSHKEYYLNFHMRQHKYRDGANFKCDDCPYFVKFLKSLIKHKKLHNNHSVSANTEGSLNVNTESVQELKNPVHVENSAKKYFRKRSLTCSKCPARFSQLDRLHRHLELHGKDFKFKCEHCDFSVQLAANIIKHKRLHEIKTHLKVSNSTKSFACPRCPAVFNNKLRFERHLKFHNRNYNNQSNFLVQGNIKLVKPKNIHLNKKNSKLLRLSKSFKCPKCPARLQSLERYKRHLEHHGGNYRFTCSYCDFSVQNAVNIQNHEKIHQIRSDLELPDCSINPEILNDIRKSEEFIPVETVTNTVINERKLYICDRCPYYSVSKTAVQSHQRSHWLKQNFECPHCDYTATQRGSLQTHVKLHLEGSKLFPPEAFMKFQSFKIIIQEENGEKLVFDDEIMINGESEKSDCQNVTLRTETTQIVKNDLTYSELNEANETYSNDTESAHSSSNLKSNKEPIVVLTDIFHKNFLKQQNSNS